MKKRIIAFLLAAMMLLAFVGCGDDGASSSVSQGGDSGSSEAEISVDKNQYINEDGTITGPDLINLPLEHSSALL